MKRLTKHCLALIVISILASAMASCVRYETYFEDDEWNGADYNGETLLLNGEIELDDFDH